MEISKSFILGVGLLNLLLALAFSPFLEGCARKLRAMLHSRIGPPILQPYYDLAKLLGKEELRSTDHLLARLTPYGCLAGIALSALLVPMGTFHPPTGTFEPPLGSYGDSILFLYCLALAAVALMVAAAASENPFAFIGASREMMMHLTVEPVLAVALTVAALNAGSFRMGEMIFWHHAHGPLPSMILAALFLFLALQAQVGKIPFDIPEAEQEVMGGAFIEFSGPRYALLRWAMMAKQMVFGSVLCQIFIPWPMIGHLFWDVLINLAKVFFLVIILALIEAVNPRLRIDQSIRYYLSLGLFSLSGVALALLGL